MVILTLLSAIFLTSCTTFINKNGIPLSQSLPATKATFTPSSVMTSTLVFKKPSKIPTRPTATMIYFPIITPMTLTPSLTSTAVPPLKPHGWISEPILVELNTWGGDGCCGIPTPPLLILYSDGRLFQSTFVEMNGEYRIQVFLRQLSQSEVCAFLNTIDQFGFFDYDPSTYRSPDSDYMPIDGAPHYVINVNAWRKKNITPYALGSYIYSEATWSEDCPECPSLPPIPPSLRNTYNLLENYPIEGAEIYNPDQIAILIERFDSEINTVEWPLSNPKLSELFTRASHNAAATGQELVLTDEEANLVFEAVNHSIDIYDGYLFNEGQQTYKLYVRPLLPFEAPADQYAIRSQIPSQGFENPSLPLSCKPSDGILTITSE